MEYSFLMCHEVDEDGNVEDAWLKISRHKEGVPPWHRDPDLKVWTVELIGLDGVE